MFTNILFLIWNVYSYLRVLEICHSTVACASGVFLKLDYSFGTLTGVFCLLQFTKYSVHNVWLWYVLDAFCTQNMYIFYFESSARNMAFMKFMWEFQ